MKRYISVAVAVVALVGIGAVLAVAGDDPPSQPPWVRADGTIDLSKAPDEFEVSGPDGRKVVCGNGHTLRVRKELLLGPPPKAPAELRAQRPGTATGDLVWRCGRGKNPHLNPILLPRSEDPLREGDG